MSLRSPSSRITLTTRQSEEGFTLIELSIAMAIFSVLALLIMYTLNGFVQIQDQTLSRFYSTSQAQNIIDRLARDLRTAVTPPGVTGVTTPFVSISPSSVTFYANLGGASPTELKAYLSPDIQGSSNCPCEFHEDVFQNGAWVSRIDGSFVASSQPVASTTVFTYFSPPTSTVATPTQISVPSTGITDSSGSQTLSQVALVGINVLTQIKSSSPLTTVNTLVELRNVAFDPNQGG